ncbi:MAG: ribosome maturation factor RimM [Rhodospirillaceae bacterium]|nr:ribosome maturation factor RimM [Rhodospirillaceae bacterium]
MAPPEKVCLGIIVGAHGVRGAVRIKSYTSVPGGIAAYGPVEDEGGSRRFRLEPIGTARGAVLARIEGVADRDAAEALRGLRLYVPRSALPAAKEDEYYHADLIGLPVETREGARLGTVGAVHNFGAGDILEVRREGGGDILLPFTASIVPEVDIAGRRIVAAPPPGLVEDAAQAEVKAGGRARRAPRRSGSRRRAASPASGDGGGDAGL